MKNINRERTDDCPEIIFDAEKKTLSITGNSYPENCELLYEPIKEFLKEYSIEENNMLNCYFYFNLINSTSTVYVAQIIVKITALAKDGLSVLIRWKYDEYDEEMLDLGEKMASISKLPFDYVPVKDED